jgi:hypothetical protein
MNMTKLALTDDEAAAVALQADGAWRAPLPTVDESSRDDVLRAILRGRRSLSVRDLADADGRPAGAAAEVVKRLGTGLRAMFMLADAAGNWLPRGITVYLYGDAVEALELSHVIAAGGVHHFRVAPPPRTWDSLTGLAGVIYAHGFAAAHGFDDAAGGPAPAAALLQVIRADGVRSIRVARGTVTTGRGPVPARFSSVPEAVAWLLA